MVHPKINWFLLVVCLLLPRAAYVQDVQQSVVINTPEYLQSDVDLPSAAFHAKNRAAFRALMPPNSIAFVFGNSIQIRSNDVMRPFVQDKNFYYLTGYNEPNGLLILFKEKHTIRNSEVNELLFVQPNNARAESWTGTRLGVAGASALLQVELVAENKEFAEFTFPLDSYNKILVQNNGVHFQNDTLDFGDIESLRKQLNVALIKADITADKDLCSDYFAELRSIKQPEEIQLLSKAIQATGAGLIEAIKATEPGKSEFQLAAVAEFVFKDYGCEALGFPSIFGAGRNACVVHYQKNRKITESGELLVIDVGAEYHGYTADIARTLPVNGRFTKEQLLLYNLVLNAQQKAIDAAIAGNKFWEPHNVAKQILIRGLLDLGIIEDPSEARNYILHGTSHYLGLDVHDPGPFNSLKTGNVITVEPGIYIPKNSKCDPRWWNIGIRIEDILLITPTKPEVLTDFVPKKAHEIERLTQQKTTVISNSN